MRKENRGETLCFGVGCVVGAAGDVLGAVGGVVLLGGTCGRGKDGRGGNSGNGERGGDCVD